MKPLLLWLVLAQCGDIATTLIGVHRGCAEANAVVSPRLHAVLAAKASVAVGFVVVLPLVHRTHPTLANTYAAIPALAGSAATAWNLRQLHRGC